MAKLNPIVSEFADEDQAAAHDAWFRAKVETALASKAEPIPHKQAMTRARQKLSKEKRA